MALIGPGVCISVNDGFVTRSSCGDNLEPTQVPLEPIQAEGSVIPPTLLPTLSINNDTVNEGQTATLTVTLSAMWSEIVTVDYATFDGTAIAGVDYLTASGTLTFNPGETNKQIDVETVNRFTVNSNRQFTVQLSTPVNAAILDGVGAVTIVDITVLPTLSINNDTVIEGELATLTVTLSSSWPNTVTVMYSTFDGTAIADINYVPVIAQTLIFLPTEVTQTIEIQTLTDMIPTSDLEFEVRLSSPTNATILDAVGTVTIEDATVLPTLSINDVMVYETEVANLTVTLSNALVYSVTVQYTTINGTAVSGSDFIAKSGTLTFAPGITTRSISIQTLSNEDANPGQVEYFTVQLSSPVNATILDGIGQVGIIDELPPPPDFVFPPVCVEPPGSENVIVLNFEGISSTPSAPMATPILEFYNGGVSGDGTTGTNYGVSFGSDALLLPLNIIGLQASNTSRGGLGDPNSQRGGMFFLDPAPVDQTTVTMNVPAGFEGGFSFYYSAINQPGSVELFSGINSTGTSLGQLLLSTTTQTGDSALPPYYASFMPFVAAGMGFTGVARSVNWTGVSNQIVFDDVTLGTIIPGPPSCIWDDYNCGSIFNMVTSSSNLFSYGIFANNKTNDRSPLYDESGNENTITVSAGGNASLVDFAYSQGDPAGCPNGLTCWRDANAAGYLYPSMLMPGPITPFTGDWITVGAIFRFDVITAPGAFILRIKYQSDDSNYGWGMWVAPDGTIYWRDSDPAATPSPGNIVSIGQTYTLFQWAYIEFRFNYITGEALCFFKNTANSFEFSNDLNNVSKAQSGMAVELCPRNLFTSSEPNVAMYRQMWTINGVGPDYGYLFYLYSHPYPQESVWLPAPDPNDFATHPAISINSVTVNEATDTTATLTVRLDKPWPEIVTVQYESVNGTATSPTDFVAVSGTLTFSPGQTALPIAVTVNNNGDTNNPPEYFTVSLTAPTNSTISVDIGTVTIQRVVPIAATLVLRRTSTSSYRNPRNINGLFACDNATTKILIAPEGTTSYTISSVDGGVTFSSPNFIPGTYNYPLYQLQYDNVLGDYWMNRDTIASTDGFTTVGTGSTQIYYSSNNGTSWTRNFGQSTDIRGYGFYVHTDGSLYFANQNNTTSEAILTRQALPKSNATQTTQTVSTNTNTRTWSISPVNGEVLWSIDTTPSTPDGKMYRTPLAHNSAPVELGTSAIPPNKVYAYSGTDALYVKSSTDTTVTLVHVSSTFVLTDVTIDFGTKCSSFVIAYGDGNYVVAARSILDVTKLLIMTAPLGNYSVWTSHNPVQTTYPQSSAVVFTNQLAYWGNDTWLYGYISPYVRNYDIKEVGLVTIDKFTIPGI